MGRHATRGTPSPMQRPPPAPQTRARTSTRALCPARHRHGTQGRAGDGPHGGGPPPSPAANCLPRHTTTRADDTFRAQGLGGTGVPRVVVRATREVAEAADRFKHSTPRRARFGGIRPLHAQRTLESAPQEVGVAGGGSSRGAGAGAPGRIVLGTGVRSLIRGGGGGARGGRGRGRGRRGGRGRRIRWESG